MPFSIPAGTDRITSKDLKVVFQPIGLADLESRNPLPVYGVDQNCVVEITQSGVNVDTWVLRVNGHPTAALDGDITSAALQTALEALPNVGAGDLTVTGVNTEGAGTHVITAAANLLNEFILFEIVDAAEPDTAVLEYVTFGSKDYIISAEISSFSYSENQETTDATAISETARIHLPTVRDMTWDAMFFDALQTWRHILQGGMAGFITVYEKGFGEGKRYFAFEALITDVNVNAEQFEKIEIEVSGRRQGDWIIRPGSYTYTTPS